MEGRNIQILRVKLDLNPALSLNKELSISIMKGHLIVPIMEVYFLLFSHILSLKEEVFKLKKGRITLVGAVIILFVGTFLFSNRSSSKGTVSEVPSIISFEEMEDFLYGDNGIVNQVQNELSEKGYRYSIMIAAYSKEDIQMKIILSNKEATESEQEEIESIFYELVGKNNLNPHAFKLKVSDSDDGPDW